MKIWWILMGLICMISCDDENSGTPLNNGQLTFLHHYVPCYTDGEWSASGSVNGVLLKLKEPVTSYTSEDVSEEKDESAEKFLSFATRNGDTGYDRTENALDYQARTSYVHNLKAIHVVCPDRDWGEAYPAGTLLDDRVGIQYTAYGRYIASGYESTESFLVRKRVSEVTVDDLKMINPYLELTFDPKPAEGFYTLHITLLTDEDKEIAVEVADVRIL